MKISKDVAIVRFVLALAISLLYAYWLSSLPHELFRDRENYMIYARDFDAILSFRLDRAIASFLFSEPLFLYINKFLRIWFSPEDTVSAIVFFNSFSVSFFCFRRFSNLFVGVLFVCLLFSSQHVLSMQLVAIRQGLGLALILLFYDYLKKDVPRLLFLLFLGLIHNSFYILFFFILLEFAFRRIKSIYIRYFALLIIGFFVFSVIYTVALRLGVKQVSNGDYVNLESARGKLFFVWIALFFFFLFFRRIFRHDSMLTNDYSLVLVGLVILSSSYYFFPVVSRMMGIFMLFLFSCSLRKMSDIKLFLLFFLIGINVYMFSGHQEKSFFAVEPRVFFKHLLFQ